MAKRGRGTGLVEATLCAAVAACHHVPPPAAVAPVTGAARAHSRIALSHELPRWESRDLEAMLVEVTYGPSESSPPHSHPCPVIVYVVAGALRTQVRGEPESVYQAGESFYEAPNRVHMVSANASAREPARFVAFFVCDPDTALSVTVPEPPAVTAPES